VLASSGDPLASHIYRPLLHTYKPKPTQSFTLFTNGLLLKKQLDKTNIMHSITQYRISVDAGSPDVYPQVRHGGDWKILMENLEYLAENKSKNSGVVLFFVLQKKNYQDVFNFVALCQKFGFHGTITQMDDWGTWNTDVVEYPDSWTAINGTYTEHNILSPLHPEYQKCREIILEMIEKTPPGIISISPQTRNLLKII
jgi:MoaA/NifB/PqqE/SkfB family radical SAM enzyme